MKPTIGILIILAAMFYASESDYKHHCETVYVCN